MEEAVKNRIILVLAILTIIFFIGTVSSCGNTYRMKLAKDKETVKVMDLEEKVNRFSQEKAKQDEKLSAVEKELEEQKAGHETTKKALVQEQLVNKSLKEELAKTTKLNEALEEDLKEALIQAKGSTKAALTKTKQ